jgi:hypothetical protein
MDEFIHHLDRIFFLIGRPIQSDHKPNTKQILAPMCSSRVSWPTKRTLSGCFVLSPVLVSSPVAPSVASDVGVRSPPTTSIEEQSEEQEADMTKSEKHFGFGGGGQGRFGNLLWHTIRWWHMVPDFRFHRFDHKKPMERTSFSFFHEVYTILHFDKFCRTHCFRFF